MSLIESQMEDSTATVPASLPDRTERGPATGLLRPGITQREFAAFSELIYRVCGIRLTEAKKALLVGRLARRLRELGLEAFGDYYDHVVAGDNPHELTLMLDSISTNETQFFREPQHFEFLEQEWLPRIRGEAEEGRRPRTLRAWSAGCSTGEEPYTLAMVLLRHLPEAEGWQVEVLATDLSTRVLAHARKGIWTEERAAQIPPAYRHEFMLRGVGEYKGMVGAGSRLRSVVRFRHFNLNDAHYDLDGTFDLVFCRNVMIYFDTAGKQQVVRKMAGCLAPEGLLFVGHSESLHGLSVPVTRHRPTIYKPAGVAKKPSGTE